MVASLEALMRSLFHSRAPEASVTIEPVATVFPRIEGADIAAVFAGRRVAGDFYDSIRVGPERVLFGLLDVAGRREENRGVLSAAQEIFRNRGCELFAQPDINESDAMTQLALHINRGLIDYANEVRSCPAFIGCYHEKFGTLCYANAGHTPALLRDNNGLSELTSTGLPLGLFSHATSDAPTVAIEKGAALLLVSRGMVECSDREDKEAEEFGMTRVKQIFQAAAMTSAQSLCESILQSAGQFSEACVMRDDRTALSLIRTG